MRVVTFGEVMLRLAPPGFDRLTQSVPGTLRATFGGGELNVAVSIARQGGRAAFLTALPDNPLTDALERELRGFGVEVDLLLRDDAGRFGVYFVEAGANQRPSTVTYDRDGSCMARRPAESWEWDRVFAEAGWLHITGITPALSEAAAGSALAAVREARRRGVAVSCDLNFRKKLWRWEPGTPPVELARRIMRELVASVDLVIGNEEDAELALGIAAERSDVEGGELDVGGYQAVAREIVRQFPGVQRVAITLRESLSASHNNWGGLLYDAALDRAWLAPTDETGQYRPYEIRNIVDRVGAGDSFAGGLIFALTGQQPADPEAALRWAVAASCLKHSLYGDFNDVSREEIEALVHGRGSGRVAR